MKFRLLFLALLTAAVQFAGAGEGMKASDEKMKTAIQSVVTQQLAAFREGNFKAAYVFADQGLKDVYSLEMFEKMVKAGYPAIASNASGRCGLTLDNGDEAVVNVRVFDKAGESLDFQYMLRRDGENWRITGVVLLKEQTTEV